MWNVINTMSSLPEDPEYVVPLKINEKLLRRALHNFMAGGHLTPDDLLDVAVITELELLYLPTYIFDGSYDATWTASFGYDRTEHYTEHEKKYDHDFKMEITRPVTKTKVVTDWRPATGTDSGTFYLSAYAGKGHPEEVANLIADMDRSSAKEFNKRILGKAKTEKFAKLPDEVYSESVDDRVDDVISSGVRRHAQGDRQRDWYWRSSVEKSHTSYVLPIGRIKYKYDGREYNFWMDGVDDKKWYADSLPVDDQRKMTLILTYVPATIAIIVIPSLGAFGGAMALTAVAWGLLRHWSIIRVSKAIRVSALARKMAEEEGSESLTSKQTYTTENGSPDITPKFINHPKWKKYFLLKH